ncbi:MAG TPA: HAD family acid phosphatase [bacterium]
MKSLKKASSFPPAALVFLLLASHSIAFSQVPHELKWVTQSIEYSALCSQVYRTAWEVVKASAKNEGSEWVVVFDVDETVLDNSRYAVELAAIDSSYSEASWAKWVVRKEATPIPGAKAFIDSLRTLPRVHVAYITDRLFAHEQATIENLQKHGLFKDGDIMLTKTSREDQKEDRRRCLESGTDRCDRFNPLVILALFGDNIRDFMPMRGKDTAEIYRTVTLTNDARWGKQFFILPNPTYGSWEREYQ